MKDSLSLDDIEGLELYNLGGLLRYLYKYNKTKCPLFVDIETGDTYHFNCFENISLDKFGGCKLYLERCSISEVSVSEIINYIEDNLYNQIMVTEIKSYFVEEKSKIAFITEYIDTVEENVEKQIFRYGELKGVPVIYIR